MPIPDITICHSVKTSLHSETYENEFSLQVHFHMKSLARELVLKKKHKVNQKLPTKSTFAGRLPRWRDNYNRARSTNRLVPKFFFSFLPNEKMPNIFLNMKLNTLMFGLRRNLYMILKQPPNFLLGGRGSSSVACCSGRVCCSLLCCWS